MILSSIVSVIFFERNKNKTEGEENYCKHEILIVLLFFSHAKNSSVDDTTVTYSVLYIVPSKTKNTPSATSPSQRRDAKLKLHDTLFDIWEIKPSDFITSSNFFRFRGFVKT